MKKNIKVMGYGLWVMVALLVSVPTVAQTFGNQEQPQTQFQSTSTMQASGSSLASQPMLNEDGTAYNPAVAEPARAGAARRTGGLPLPGNPGHEGGDNTPVGDAVLPLMLMALAFGGVIWLRRRRVAKR